MDSPEHSAIENGEYAISDKELRHVIHAIAGGMAICRISDPLETLYFTDGVSALTGHTREEYEKLTAENSMAMVYEPDRVRILSQVHRTIRENVSFDLIYRKRHKDGYLIWVHASGCRMDAEGGQQIVVTCTSMSAENSLYQCVNEQATDSIFIIDRREYEILYGNRSQNGMARELIGRKCFEYFHGRAAPCADCILLRHQPGENYEINMLHGKIYTCRYQNADWNGIPAIALYARNISGEVKVREDKQRLEQYFKTVVKNLPGGIVVMRCDAKGHPVPEYLSEGFAKMCGMSTEEAWRLYAHDALAGTHPDEREEVARIFNQFLKQNLSRYEMTYRLQSGKTGCIWAHSVFSADPLPDGGCRIYAVYRDVTKEREAQDALRKQYNDLIFQHYLTPGPDTLAVGHCNVTRNYMIELKDFTENHLLAGYGTVREDFFIGISQMILSCEERQAFCIAFLEEGALRAYREGNRQFSEQYFLHLPGEETGRYVRFDMQLIEMLDTGELMDILSMTDVTEKVISDRMLRSLSTTGCELIVSVDLRRDTYQMLFVGDHAACAQPPFGCYSQWMNKILNTCILPKDQDSYQKHMDGVHMQEMLHTQDKYTFAFSTAVDGQVYCKSMTVACVDRRLQRVCLMRTDITDSMREQQGMLAALMDTCELISFVQTGTKRMTMYTRQVVQKDLQPYVLDSYSDAICDIERTYMEASGQPPIRTLFSLEYISRMLDQQPQGYDLVLTAKVHGQLHYKKVSFLWGNKEHSVICLVRADVTDMISAERESQRKLEQALEEARKASRSKSDFLSSMSHDIRTPMNAIIGMTTLADARVEDSAFVKECLGKISTSSQYLLGLINDVLDMSKIEQMKVSLNQTDVSMEEIVQRVSTIITPQMNLHALNFTVNMGELAHPFFHGDLLRIQQILNNILSNAAKFTPDGGKVTLCVDEITPKQPDKACYRFTVEDTGMGMPADFVAHLFEPFTRSKTVQHVEGTGLGMSITKGLVDLMGGIIFVQSELGRGTTFVVELEFEPRLWVPADKTIDGAQESPKRDSLSGMHFLVVEDNEINAEILVGLLKMYGVSYEVRNNGVQAVQAFMEHPADTYDAILMDVQMPVMNGYEATRRIRVCGHSDAQRIPIIAMTANAFAEDVKIALEAGMDAHIAKPIDLRQMLSTLKKVIREKKAKQDQDA